MGRRSGMLSIGQVELPVFPPHSWCQPLSQSINFLDISEQGIKYQYQHPYDFLISNYMNRYGVWYLYFRP